MDSPKVEVLARDLGRANLMLKSMISLSEVLEDFADKRKHMCLFRVVWLGSDWAGIFQLSISKGIKFDAKIYGIFWIFVGGPNKLSALFPGWYNFNIFIEIPKESNEGSWIAFSVPIYVPFF